MTFFNPVSDTAQCTLAPAGTTPLHDIDILLPDGAPIAGTRMIEDMFTAANELLTDGGYSLSVRHLSEPHHQDPRRWSRRTVVFLGDIHSRWQVSDSDRHKVQRIIRLAPRTVLVGGAVFLLGETGMRDNHQIAVHPNFLAAAEEEHLTPAQGGGHTAHSNALHSATSPFAALTLFIDLIRDDHGQFIAGALAEYLGLSHPSERTRSKVALHLKQRAEGDALIARILDLMQDHIEEPKRVRDLARQVGVSTRKLERRFQEKTDTTPLVAYRNLRIERAHQLMVHSSLSLPEIVIATGFSSLTNLSYWCRKELGSSPRTLRRQAFATANEARSA
ncbi:helix-turn-helix domain-containing protein [Falsiruegeria mediterranea]|jgi:transcriptional regulator GlxA family with amidase domain